MRQAVSIKVLSAVVLGVLLLGQMSPVAMEVLLCLGDGADADCCPEPDDAGTIRVDAPGPRVGAPDCDCCVTVAVAATVATTGHHEAPLDVAPESDRLRDGASPAGTSLTGRSPGSTGNTPLAALRTIVLLI